MTSFTNRIKPDSTELERYFLSVYTGNLWDALEKIKDWHSPEHIEKEVQMKLLKLQQQALPVVPECVDKWYKFHMNGTFSAVITAYAVDGADKPVIWLVQNGGMDLLCKMKLYGYTVEKPQLFYLKHIDMSKSDAHLNWYLAKGPDNVLLHQGIKKDKSPKLKCILKLTQQEIDSMQTGSYEQIEVTE